MFGITHTANTLVGDVSTVQQDTGVVADPI
jgi:hypothetical protein